MKDSEMQALCLKEVKPFAASEIPLVCAKPLSSLGSVEETKEHKLEKLKKFREMRKQQAKVEYCKDLNNVQNTLQEKELIENVKMFNPLF